MLGVIREVERVLEVDVGAWPVDRTSVSHWRRAFLTSCPHNQTLPDRGSPCTTGCVARAGVGNAKCQDVGTLQASLMEWHDVVCGKARATEVVQ